MNLKFITFATFGENGTRDYSENVNRLQVQLSNYGFQLHAYTFGDLAKLELSPIEKAYLKLHKGVGFWFWKPILIQDMLKNKGISGCVYLDADCQILQDPNSPLQPILKRSDFSMFPQKMNILNWTSTRARRKFKLSKSQAAQMKMYSATVIVVRNSKESELILSIWRRAMQDPNLLLDQIIDSKRHRNDQSILSLLAGVGQIVVDSIERGFYANGPETVEVKMEDAWIATNIGQEISYSKGLLFFRRLGGWMRTTFGIIKFRIWYKYRKLRHRLILILRHS